WITSIAYTGFGTVTHNTEGLPINLILQQAAFNTIDFDYDELSPVFENGRVMTAHTQLSRRLKKVRVSADGTELSSYSIQYNQSEYTGRYRLTSIPRWDADGNCFAPMIFYWSDPSSTTLTPPVAVLSNSWGNGLGGFKKVKSAPLQSS